jgi:hypothetical protein
MYRYHTPNSRCIDVKHKSESCILSKDLYAANIGLVALLCHLALIKYCQDGETLGTKIDWMRKGMNTEFW